MGGAPAKLQLVRATRTFSACKQRKKKKNLPSNSSWGERRVRSLRGSNAKKKRICRATPAGASDAYVLCVQATQKKKNSMEDPTTPVPLHHPCVYNFVGVI